MMLGYPNFRKPRNVLNMDCICFVPVLYYIRLYIVHFHMICRVCVHDMCIVLWWHGIVWHSYDDGTYSSGFFAALLHCNAKHIMWYWFVLSFQFYYIILYIILFHCYMTFVSLCDTTAYDDSMKEQILWNDVVYFCLIIL